MAFEISRQLLLGAQALHVVTILPLPVEQNQLATLDVTDEGYSFAGTGLRTQYDWEVSPCPVKYFPESQSLQLILPAPV